MHRSKIIHCLLLFLTAWSCGSESPNETHVFITNTGALYHLEECSYLGKSKIPVPLKEAWNKGYNPCQKCFAVTPRFEDAAQAAQPVLKEDAGGEKSYKTEKKEVPEENSSQRCTGITRKGLQCKRITRNANGRCYQHQP